MPPVDPRIADAERLARQILSADPNEPHALLTLGVICAKSGRLPESEGLLRRIPRTDPNYGQAEMWLAVALRGQGRAEEALPLALDAATRMPQDAMAHYQLGLCLLELGNLREAQQAVQTAVLLDPHAATLHDTHGRILYELGRHEEAISEFRQALAISPANVQTLHQLAIALMEQSDGVAAVECARRLVKLSPCSAEAQILLARALLLAQRAEEALACIQELLQQEPHSAPALIVGGQILQGAGRIAEAQALFEKAVQTNSFQGQAYRAMVHGRRVGSEDLEIIAHMEGLVKSESRPAQELSSLHYALGKAYDDLGDYEKAMLHFDEANRIEHGVKFGDRPFDQGAHSETVDALIKAFTPDFLASHIDAGSGDERPLFVVGMMRSGTTLTNQILSSHPEVGSAGEQRYWFNVRNDAFNLREPSLNSQRLKELARNYLALLEEYAPGKKRVVDKMPGNVTVLGLIYLAFPKARIVHVSRHPADTCISIYATPNGSRVSWGHNKENTVFAYREHLRLIDHWRQVLPLGHILELQYEDLVRDRDQTTRRLIEFCGLEWNDSCLSPEANEVAVATPSAWQVRQPVYTNSLERWRNYEPWLGAFGELI